MRSLVFILTFILTSVIYGQQRSYHEDAIKYLEINGTEQQYEGAVDQMFVMLQQQYQDRNVPDSVWDELKNQKEDAIINIKSLLVSAYRSNFSQDDIRQLITFYESETGSQVVADITQLTDAQKAELNAFYNSEVGKKVQNQSETLTMMVSEVSELWSRSLYEQTIEKLTGKGY
ncbi:hypothetical protein GCM10022393_03540 [Aquimarina addita]|uniref:DUF2059 domain-containing protein n=1 Tax=Aquimarina addita TaxID=870485 RepID=A0ABP7X9S3_9FLAO